MRLLPLLLALTACSATACSPAALLTAPLAGGDYAATRNIAYADGPRHTLDIYVPNNLHHPAPVIVFFYGGSWQMGSKRIYPFVGAAFAEQGFITVIPDYQVYPQVYFPTFMQDAAAAAAWTQQHIAQYGGDPRNIFVAGHSAGAQIAALLALDPTYLAAAGSSPDQLRGLIGLAGPYDFLPLTDPKLIALFSHADIRTTQPINYANGVLSGGRKPPSFLATGAADTTVEPKNTYNLAHALQDAGNSVDVRTYPGVGHIGLALSLSGLFRGKDPALEDIAAFIRQHTQPSATTPPPAQYPHVAEPTE